MKNVILILLTFLVGCDSSKKKEEVNLSVKKFKLDNGLRTLLIKDKSLPLVSVRLYYNVGGKFEAKGLTGSSHFLEHMMFKGSKKFGPGAFEQLTNRNGGNNNAYTSFDSTVYYENVLSSDLNDVLDAEADRMINLALEEDSFKKEKNVILEERKIRYENSPWGKVFLTTMQNLFKGTPYGGSVIGHISDIKEVTRKQMYEYYQFFYAPNNVILVVAGDIDLNEIKKKVQDKFSSLKRSEKLDAFFDKFDKESSFEIKLGESKEIDLNARSANPIFMYAFPSYKITDRKGFILDLLSTMVGELKSSYLQQKYVYGDKPTLSSLSTGNYTLMHAGTFYFSGELLSKTSLKDFKSLIKEDLKDLCTKGINQKVLEATKNSFLSSYYSGLETNSGRAKFVGDREHFFGDYRFYKKEIDLYSNISLAEIKTECLKLVSSKESVFVTAWEKNPETGAKK